MSESWKETRALRRPCRARGLLVLLPVLAALASCATQPFSFLDGYRWNRAELNTYDTQIVEIDGTSYSWNSDIRVDPGRHHIVFQTAPLQGFFVSPQEVMDLDVEPCMRYWFEAKRVNALQQEFEPRVNYKERIPGCGTATASAAEPERRMGGY